MNPSPARLFRWGSLLLLCLSLHARTESLDRTLQAAGDNRAELETALTRVPANQRAGMTFLITHMPEPDARSLSADWLLEQVEAAYRARETFPWAARVPEEIFLNDVLPYATLDERRDAWREDFFQRFSRIVEGAGNQMDAIQAINAAIQEEVGVEYSTQRKKANQSPYESMEQGKASCTGLSILLVNAFRSVGIPARIAGTPAWTTKPGNHNWVEIWTPADQAWHFTEYYPDAKGLDHGWLLADAARANADSLIHRIYATSWRRTDLFFPLVWNFRDRSVPAVNVTGRYLELGSHLVQEDACELRIHFTGGSGREAIPVRVMQGDAEVGRGMTPGPTDDLNRYLTLPVRKGQMYQIHWTDPESGQPRNRRVQTPQDETWLMLHLVEAASWMSVLPGDTLLSRLTIPGTHNAGALHEPFPGTAKCQDLSIAEQLAIGVRFLDIRCRWESGDFHIHHGPVDQKQRLADVLQTLYRFLQQQPGETVVMLLLPRDPERTLDGWLQREIEAQPQRWWQGEEIPHLQDCRGKIVLLRRFPSNLSVGLSAQPWRNNTSFQNPWLQVQDRYRPDSVEEKWQAMEEAFQLALDDTGGNRLHLNYSSGFLPGLMGIPSIAAVKERIHPALARYLLQTPATPLGCILLDFATPALVEQIFTANLQ